MQISQYIVIKKTSKWRYSSRMTKGSPALASNEIAVKVVLEIPDEIFDKPALVANISIPEEAVSKPVIEAQVVDNVEQIIKQQTGFDVRLEVVDPNNEDGEEN